MKGIDRTDRTAKTAERPIRHRSEIPIGLRLGELPGAFASIPRLLAEDVDNFANDLADFRSAGARPDGPW